MSPAERPAQDGDRRVEDLLARTRRQLGGDAEPDGSMVQVLLTTGVALAADLMDRGTRWTPFLPDVELTPTEVALAVCAMLEAADIDMPQLTMWQALGIGQPPVEDESLETRPPRGVEAE